MTARDFIRIEGLQVVCTVGVRPEERTREQPVILDLELGLDLQDAGRLARMSRTIDYSRVAIEVAALLKFRRYRLIEVAVEETAAMLLGVHTRLRSISVLLRKPEALAAARAMASVQIVRDRADYPSRIETTKWGRAEILLETRDAGLYLLHVDPGRSIPRHHHRVMRELEWLIDGELWRNGRQVRPVDPVAWERGQIHDYHNRTSRPATLFCCDVPPFIPADEIEVDEAASAGERGSASTKKGTGH